MRLTLVIAALALPATSLSAQRTFDPERLDRTETGTRFKIAEEAVDSGKMRVMQKRIARCAALNDRELAQELLEKSDPVTVDYGELSVEYGEMLDEMSFSRCIGRAMPRSARMMRVRSDGATMRNLFAEEIYLHENDEPPVIGEGDPELLDNRYYAGGRSYMMAQVPAQLADCIVYRAPAEAHEFLETNPTTSDEREAAEALGSVVDECLPGEDSEVSFSLAQLRGYVADGLWSRSHYGPMASSAAKVDSEGESEE